MCDSPSFNETVRRTNSKCSEMGGAACSSCACGLWWFQEKLVRTEAICAMNRAYKRGAFVRLCARVYACTFIGVYGCVSVNS